MTQKNSRPNHPTTCGKVERFQQTSRPGWPGKATHPPPSSDLQAPARPVPPASTTPNGPTAPSPAHPRRRLRRPTQSRTTRRTPDRTHARIRHDKVNNGKITLRHAGTLYSIGLGRHHNGRPVLALVHGLDITIRDATTGELLRQLTLDTTRKYQPQHSNRARTLRVRALPMS